MFSVRLPAILSLAAMLILTSGAGAQIPKNAKFRHGLDGHPKKQRTPEERVREALVWNRANEARLAKSGVRFASRTAVTDTNDVAIVNGDARVLVGQNLFDLEGRTVTFTPQGAGYVVTASTGTLDANLGAKIDLSAAPAVNPNPIAERGDDGYFPQDLGFTFPLYGANYTTAAIGSNGNVTFKPAGMSDAVFDSAASEPQQSLNGLMSGPPRLAAYWTDLDASPSQISGDAGIWVRRDADRVVVTYNNIPDFGDIGVHRFQITLFRDGRFTYFYQRVQLTTGAITAATPGTTTATPQLVDFAAPPSAPQSGPLAETFSTVARLDDVAAIRAFFDSAPNRDQYDFLYLITDFDVDLDDAFAYYAPIRNRITGIGHPIGDSDPGGRQFGGSRFEGYLNLSNLLDGYPNSPTARFLGANNALSIFGQEQGHRWLAFISEPGGNRRAILGRDDAHWSFFYNAESTLSHPAAPRSSSMEGNVWRDNGDGSFQSIGLIDGFSRLDQYLMGLRPASDVADSFVIEDPVTGFPPRTRSSGPTPNVTARGTRRTIRTEDLVSANGTRNPAAVDAPKNFRAAWLVIVRDGMQPSAGFMDKVERFRLAWESYFAQSTDFLATINTGLSEMQTPRAIATVAASNYSAAVAPNGIATIFGRGLTAGATEQTPSANLPTTLAGTQVLVDGLPAGLLLASPDQINFVMPRGVLASTGSVPSSSSTIEVLSNGARIRAGAVQVAPSVPSFFTVDRTGAGPAAAQDAFDFSGAPFRARRANGEPNIISVYGTGFGADAASGNVADQVRGTLNGNEVRVDYAGPAPDFPGLNQVNIVLPANIAPGNYNLVVTRNNVPGNTVVLQIRQ